MAQKQLTKADIKKMSTDELYRYVQKLKDRAAEPVTGIFKNNEARGGSVRFNYKMWDGDDFTKDYELIDGERYTIPRGVAQHLNNNCFYYEYKHLPREDGEAGVRGASNYTGRIRAEDMTQKRKIHRYEFRSLEFMDEDLDMYPAKLVEVQSALK